MPEPYDRLLSATSGLDTPFAVIDEPALWTNADDLVRRAGGVPIRVASKSVRVWSIIEHTLARDGFAGVMSYSLAESVWLVDPRHRRHLAGLPDDQQVSARPSHQRRPTPRTDHPDGRQHRVARPHRQPARTGPPRYPGVHRRRRVAQDRVRTPWSPWPEGLSHIGTEGAGEVQTPVRGKAARALRVGDRVVMRHAKAGEMCERFDQSCSSAPTSSTELVPTYRGEGRNFG